ENNLERLTKFAEEKKIKTINTGDWHTPDSEELSDKPDYITKFPLHCLIGTKGAEYVPATNPQDTYVIDWRDKTFDAGKVKAHRNIILYKDAFDIFEGSSHADRVLEIIKPDIAVVYGVATNVCVNYAVNGLLARGVDVYVPTDAIKELPNLPLEETISAWKKAGAKLTTTQQILEGLL
ncbi:cysteine hydrolase family protein, partial [Candidatus Woesearchaeota archaeon]|nr:cysteine hydrolase family protein [Candidatus Woesearchaeota archaeon]